MAKNIDPSPSMNILPSISASKNVYEKVSDSPKFSSSKNGPPSKTSKLQDLKISIIITLAFGGISQKKKISRTIIYKVFSWYAMDLIYG